MIIIIFLDDCSKMNCQFHSVCESDGMEAKCVCPTFKCANVSKKQSVLNCFQLIN